MLVARWMKGLASLEAEDALEIMRQVFVEDQGFFDDVEETDQTAWHLVLYEDGKPLGCARLFLEQESVAHAGRIALRKEYRGRHLGSLLMKEIDEKAAELGARKIILGAQYQAVPFYEKQGYRSCSGEYLDQGYPHYQMEKEMKSTQEGDY